MKVSTQSDPIAAMISAARPGSVWSAADFARLGNRDALDKDLQRRVARGELRRIGRGLCDRPATSRLTKRPAPTDDRAVIGALARRDQTRLMVDGLTAANELGLRDAVPARLTIYSDTRRRAVRLDQPVIEFKRAAPSRLYRAGRPAMRVVQALHGLRDILPGEGDRVRQTLARLFADKEHGAAIRADLAAGFGALPIGMQSFLRGVPGFDPAGGPTQDNPPIQGAVAVSSPSRTKVLGHEPGVPRGHRRIGC